MTLKLKMLRICSVSTLKIPYDITRIKDHRWHLIAQHDGLYLSMYVNDEPSNYDAVYNTYTHTHSLYFIKGNKVVRSISQEIGYDK